MTERIKKGSIRRRLIIVFIFSFSVVLLANLFLYNNINKSIDDIDQVYVSNMELNELMEALGDVQDSVYEYLNTQSSEALENYYRSEQSYRKLIGELNGSTIDNEIIIMQKNIKNMSDTYLDMIDEAVAAKRGRNIEKYKVIYEDAVTMYDYINNYIHSLNNEQFKYNSNNYERLLLSFRYLEVISMTVLAIITVFNIALIIIVTRSVTEPLTMLTKAAYEVAAGNFDVDLLHEDSTDEIEIVTKAFNYMIDSIHQYITKIKESMELENKMKEKELMMINHLKDAQLKYLQAQINPHFLFNTLNAGVSLAMMEEADKTALYIENMSNFFRSNMKSFEQDSTIRDEINLVDSYIYILNVRFSGGIHFYKEIDESVIDTRVPSMILQPIVENSVNYGIRDIDYMGEIRLKVIMVEDCIDIIVSDNGAGIDDAIVRRIMSANLEDKASISESAVAKDSNGIGLGNVINRLRLYYNREDVFEIASEGRNRGTTVTLHIPN
ncbi:histidine kinase [Lachnospiraceae bacterium MD1]|jgi:two-component system sensor histidine kinase YesM|uniref:Histidine kinase n=1 Tax=Variimorphobacter saccharofermentans TaxID=2755051 RepID=A0A839K113_9FIRM|nr:histidine kinase [Variimorphobacter saccharofermentans]MBB2182619.1 histidine kinase [Variimorphobacter saccharofermentans]